MRRFPSAAMTALLATASLQNVAYTILIPFVPTLRDDYGMSVLMIGLAFSGFTAVKALVQPLGGWAADRYSPRAVAILGLMTAAVATGGLAATTSATGVVVCRLVWGLGEGFSMPALYRLVSDLARDTGTSPGQAMGWFGSAAVIGMTAGPGLVALLSPALTFSGAFILGTVLTVASAGLLLCVQTRSPAHSQEAAAPVSGDSLRLPRRTLWIMVAGLGLIDLLNNFLYSALEPVLPLFVHDELGIDDRSISFLFFCGLGVFAVVSPLAGHLTAKRAPVLLAAAALGLQAAALGLPPLFGTYSAYVTGFLILMSLQPVVFVGVRTGLATVNAGAQGKAFGWFGLISDLGWVAGPLVATGLLAAWQSAVFFAFAGIAVIGAAAALLTHRVGGRRPLDSSSWEPAPDEGRRPVGS
ncbi:MFS transporter [Amycolatopsis sp. cmx-11-51]|uniref:MFS transporter n=1 Tax=unclassified Amycolatopsis TaxID=2618356 RepID=UPI0039E3DDFB